MQRQQNSDIVQRKQYGKRISQPSTTPFRTNIAKSQSKFQKQKKKRIAQSILFVPYPCPRQLFFCFEMDMFWAGRHQLRWLVQDGHNTV